MDVDKRHKILASETKDSKQEAARASACLCRFLLSPKSHGLRWKLCSWWFYMVAEEHWTWGTHHLVGSSRQTSSLSWRKTWFHPSELLPINTTPAKRSFAFLEFPRRCVEALKTHQGPSLSTLLCANHYAKHLISIISSHPHKPIMSPFYRWVARNREVTQLISNGSRRSNKGT